MPNEQTINWEERIPYKDVPWTMLSLPQKVEVQAFWQSDIGRHIKACRRAKENRQYLKRLRYDAAGKNLIDPNDEYFDGKTWKHDRPIQMTLEGF
ncbi:MAG: hypothetical protein ACYTBJ_00615 [Planctomycetota bacterium]|jgi:hypothetical protein